MCGDECLGYRRGRELVESLGNLGHVALVNEHPVCQTPTADDAEDARPRGKAPCRRPAGDHRSRHLEAGNVGRRPRGSGIASFSLRDICRVQPGKSHLDEDVVATWDRVWSLDDRDHLVRAGTRECDCAHSGSVCDGARPVSNSASSPAGTALSIEAGMLAAADVRRPVAYTTTVVVDSADGSSAERRRTRTERADRRAARSRPAPFSGPPPKNAVGPVDLLDESQLAAVHEASLALLENVGIEFMGAAARGVFARCRGTRRRGDGRRAHPP